MYLSLLELQEKFNTLSLGDNCKIGPNVLIGENVLIGDNCKIDGNITIGDNVAIGDYSILKGDVIIGDNCKFGDFTTTNGKIIIEKNCIVNTFCMFEGITTIHENVKIFSYVNIGTDPQAMFFEGEDSEVVIGKNSEIREKCVIHRGTKKDNMITSIGENCYMMCNTHVGHDAVIGDNATIGPGCLFGGHSRIGSNVRFSGNISVLPFSRIGNGCMIGANCKIGSDVPHFSLVTSNSDYIKGMNLVGLKRTGESSDAVKKISRAYNDMLKSDKPVKDVAKNYINDDNEKIRMIAEFILAESKNGLQRR